MTSSLDSIYRKMVPSLEPGVNGHLPEGQKDPARQISPTVAHELNNILTIIQGYADRLLIKHGENEAIQRHLKLISDAANRASVLVRTTAAPEMDRPPRPQPVTPPVAVA